MILKNFCNIGGRTQHITTVKCPSGNTSNVSTTTSTYTTAFMETNEDTQTYKFASTGGIWMDVGFGDTPATADDYVLADGNASNSKLTSVSQRCVYKGPRDLYSFIATFRNDGASDVVVKEVGIYGCCANNDQGDVYHFAVLMFRSVLTSPVTIKPNETYTFHYLVSVE